MNYLFSQLTAIAQITFDTVPPHPPTIAEILILIGVYLFMGCFVLSIGYFLWYIIVTAKAIWHKDYGKAARIINKAYRYANEGLSPIAPTVLDGAYLALKAQDYELAETLAAKAQKINLSEMAPLLLRIYIAFKQRRSIRVASALQELQNTYPNSDMPADISNIISKLKAQLESDDESDPQYLLIYQETADNIYNGRAKFVYYSFVSLSIFAVMLMVAFIYYGL